MFQRLFRIQERTRDNTLIRNELKRERVDRGSWNWIVARAHGGCRVLLLLLPPPLLGLLLSCAPG